MPRAILMFKLPQERDEYKLATDAGKLQSVFWEFTQYLRSKIKYEEHTEEEYKIYNEIRDHFNSLCIDEGVDL